MADDNVQVVREDSVLVISDYRITIPGPIREHFGFEDGDLVTIRLLIGGETESFNRPLERGRVTIPASIRDEHGIEEGDQVDIEVEVP